MTRQSEAVAQNSGGIAIVALLGLMDYKDYLAELKSDQRRKLEIFGEVKDARTVVLAVMRIENLTNAKARVYPDQSTLVIGQEQVKAATFLSDGDLGGDIFPGVVKEGIVPFFLKRVSLSEASANALISIGGPVDGDSFRRLGPDYTLRLVVGDQLIPII
jgi:hypothetical protein